jgi:hypothetical protein
LTDNTVSSNTAGGNGGGIDNHGLLTLRDSTISGNTSGSGGGIYVGHSGLLTVANSTLSGNATEGSGGGIDVDGSVTVTNSTISGNIAERGGGGLFNQGLLEVIDTTVSNNTAMLFSGGVSNGGTLMLIGSTVVGNTSAGHSGGIGNIGTATLTNVTVSQNESDLAGGIRNHVIGGNAGTMTVVSTTVSENVAPNGATGIQNESEMTMRNTIVEGDCQLFSPLESRGGNVESPGNTCTLIPPFDLFNVQAAQLGLGALADNGGPTETQALAPFSVALDRIPEPECIDTAGLPLVTDQRGKPRPETGGTMCDVGAFERQPEDP